MPISVKLLLVCETTEQAAPVQAQLSSAGFAIEPEIVDHLGATQPVFGAGHWDAACILTGPDAATVAAALYGIRHRSPRTRCIVVGDGADGSVVTGHEIGPYRCVGVARLPDLPATLAAELNTGTHPPTIAAGQLACCPRFLRNILATVPQEIIVRDAQTRIVFVNEALTFFHECRPEDMLGLRDADVWLMYGRPRQQISEWLDQDRQVMESGDSLAYVQEIRRPDGAVAYFNNLKMAIDHDNAERYLMAMYSDITAQQLAEAKLSQARAEAAELAGIRKITATYAHEINNPLTGIIGIVQILLDEGIDDDGTLEMLTEMQSAAYRIKDVINKLETISHPQTRPYLEHSELIDLREGV